MTDEPDDPLRVCAACRHYLHGACMGWWHWCPCECGLGGVNDPLRLPQHLNGHQGEP